MSSVEEALKAREKRKKEQEEGIQAKMGKIDSAFEAYKNRIESTVQSSSVEIAKRINAEIDAIKKTSTPSFGSESFKNTMESTRANRVNVSNLKREVESYKGYLDEDTYKSFIDTLNSMDESYSSIIESSKAYSQFESKEDFDTWYEQYKETQAILSDKDFDNFVEAGKRVANPTWEDSYAPVDIFGWTPFGEGEKINNMVTFVDSNSKGLAEKSAQGMISGGLSDREKFMSLMQMYMTDEEKSIYNYYIGKGETEKAEKYLYGLEDTFNQRHGGVLAEQADASAIAEIMLSAVSGLDSFASGVGNLDNLIMGTEADPTTALQYGHAKASENNEGVWKVLNDFAYTVGNQLPSILVSTVVPVGGQIAGAATMGASATGNAYAEMRNLGYNANQARAYAAMVGVSEAGLQYALGGISKLGGKLTGKGIGNLASKFDSAIARTAIQLGGSMASEAFEEGTQTVLESAFKALATGEDFEAPEWGDVFYSALLGALSAGALEGAPTIAGTAINSHKATKLYGDSAGALVTESLDIDPENAHAQRMQARLDDGKSVSGYQLNRLVEANEQTLYKQDKGKIASAVTERLTQLGEEGDVGKLSEVVAKKIAGEKLSMSEKTILKDSWYGQRVINEMTPSNMESGEYTSKWAENIGTERIKTEAYNKSLYDLASEQAGVAVGDVNTSATKNTPEKENATETKFEVSTDGKTANESTGETITIDKSNAIANTKIVDGKRVVYFNTDKGVVESTNVKYASREEGLLYEAFVDMNPAFANAVIKNYDGSVPIQTYINGMREGMLVYGMNNFQAVGKDISKDSFIAELSEADQGFALKLGRAYAKSDAKKADKPLNTAIKKASEGASKAEGGKKVKKGGVSFENGAKARTGSQRKMVSLAKHLARAIGIDIVFYDATIKGTANSDANGWYDEETDTIHLDLQNSASDAKTIAFTLSHELMHFIKKRSATQFNTFSKFLMEQYAEHGVNTSDLLKKKMAELGTSDANFAYEEMICDACETLLLDSNATVKLMELRKTDLNLFETIKMHILELLNKIRAEYRRLGLKPTSDEAKALLKMEDVLDQIYAKFEEALVVATQNYQASIGLRNLEDFAKAETTDGRKLFQYKAIEADERTYRDMLKKWGKMSNEQINNLFLTIDKAMEIIKDNLEVLDYAWEADIDDRAFSPVKPNSDKLYQVSLDFSTLCRKRILQQTVQAQLQEALNKPLTKEEGIAIRDALIALQEEGRQIEVACALCYVESARMKSPEQIKRFMENKEKVIKEFFAGKSGGSMKEKIKKAEADAKEKLHRENPNGIKGKDGTTMLNPRTATLKELPKKYADEIRSAKKATKESYIPTAKEQKLIDLAKEMTVSDFTSPEGLENLAKNHRELFDAYTSYVRNATKSKGIESDTWWRAGDSMQIGDVLIANMNKENGLRSQSWSDFQVVHILDYIAATIELATRNTKEQAYTKVPDYAELMGNTGVMINLSLIPTAKFNGKLEYDNIEGIDYNKALELRNKYHATVGTICIGIDNVQIKMLLDDVTVDYVIPYHKSGMSAAIRKVMHIPTWSQYEEYQSEKNLSRAEAEKQAKKYGVKLLAEGDANYQKGTSFSEWFDLKEAQQIAKMENANPSDMAKQKKYGVMYGGYMAMQNAANNYLKLCAERGIAPKFSHEKADFTTEENYWKLLIDRKMVDNVTGEVIEQQTIKPIFDEGEVMRILNDELERYPKVKEDQDYAIRRVTEEYLSGNLKGGMSAEAIAKIMQTPVDNVTKVNIVASSESGHNTGIKKQAKPSKKDPRYLDPRTITEADVVELLNNVNMGAYHDNTYIPIRTSTPPMLIYWAKLKMGDVIDNNPIVMSVQKAHQAMAREGMDETGRPHELSVNDMVSIIKKMNDPRYIVYQGSNGRYVEVIDYATEDGRKAFAILEIGDNKDSVYMNGFEGDLYNVLVTTFPPDAGELHKLLNNPKNKVVFDKEKDDSQRTSGSNVPSVLNDSPFYEDIIPQEELIVKKQLEKTSPTYMEQELLYEGQAKFQEKRISNRSLLANALESVAQNDIERRKLDEYKKKIALIESEQAKLAEIREKIKELSFAKGRRDTDAIKKLQFEANQTANRINTYDKQLLNLESTKALKGVLEREKQMAYKRAEQRGKEALAAYRERATKTQRELITRYQESRKNNVESRHKTAMRHKIKDVVNELNQYLTKGTKDKHIPIQLQKPVAEALYAVNMDTVGAEARIAKKQAEMRTAKSLDEMQRLSKEIEHIQEMGGKLDAKLSRLKTAYDSIINSDDPLIANSHDDVIANTIDKVIEVVGDTPLRDMSLYQLEAVYDMYRMVLASIRNANKTFKAEKGKEISVLANTVIADLDGKKRNPLNPANTNFAWNNLKPVYAFERIGSNTFTKLFNAVREGEDVWAKDMSEAQTFREEQSKAHKFESWDFEKKYTFETNRGVSFDLDLGEMMSIYAFAKDEHSKGHLIGEGFVFDPNKKVVKEVKGKIKVKVNLEDATAYNLSESTLENIISTLTPEQKAFADAMQEYLSGTMGEKGNEVSLELYEIKLFKNKHYFPLKVAPQYMAIAKEKAQGDVKIKNKGFTKDRKEGAKNPIVISSFMDVWANHVNEMSMYHAFTLPLEDFYRVFNYKTPYMEGYAPMSVNQSIQNAHGVAATSYIEQLLKDINGGARSDPRENVGKALMSRFKKASVMGSLSVVIQQPSAIVRATALVDARYFVGKKVAKGKHKELWAEVKKYAPVAVIKEMGYFDTGIGKGSVEWLKGEKTFMDKVDDATSKLPALADEVTWVAIWNAVKRETLHTHKDLKPNSDEFLKAVGKRFTEVIVKTQVYDSTLARSANMRSKGTFMNMATAFMAEPTTSINMLQDAIHKGNKKYIGRAFGAVVGSVILNSALVSIVYTMRDDDEDETFIEKYLSRFTTEIIDGVNPITYIPFFKDIWSLLQGFDVERADMSLINDVIDSLQQMVKLVNKDTSDMDEDELSEHRKAVTESILGITDTIASLAGVPVKNIRRDINGIINAFNTIKKDVAERDTTGGSLGDNILEDVKDSVPVWGWLPNDSKGDKLYDAIMKGDTAYIDRLKSGYKSESAYISAIRTALRENDLRIKEAAEARYNGDIAEYMRIAKSIIAEGYFKQDDVVAAINSEITALKKNDGKSDTSESSDKVKSIYELSDYYTALVGRDQATAYVVKEDLIKTDVANGKDRDEAESDFNSKFASHLRDLHENGDLSDYDAKNMLVNYGGKTYEQANAKVQYWNFRKKYPDYDLSEEAVTKYYEDVEPYGIGIGVYYDYSKSRAKCKGIDSDGDGRADSGTVKYQVMDVIDSLPISNKQKDALYYLNGWPANTINEAPWH